MSVPVVRTELGKKRSFKFAAPFAWNNVQIKLHLKELVSLDVFKVILNNLEMETLGYRCFDKLCIDILFCVCMYALMLSVKPT